MRVKSVGDCERSLAVLLASVYGCDALDQAVWVRRREGANLAGLVHHTDAGSPSTRRLRSPNAWLL